MQGKPVHNFYGIHSLFYKDEYRFIVKPYIATLCSINGYRNWILSIFVKRGPMK